jgi:hypothetical protein
MLEENELGSNEETTVNLFELYVGRGTGVNQVLSVVRWDYSIGKFFVVSRRLFRRFQEIVL